MAMKLIREEIEDARVVIEEAANGGKKNLYIEGTYLQSAIGNRNGRIYPEHIMDKEVNRYINEVVNTNKAWGELNHPDSPKINPRDISHRIVSLVKEGTDWIGKAIITDTPMGNIARGLIESGGQIGVSSRALGTLKRNNQGLNEVQDDFRLSTAADIVLDPSGPNCFVDGIMEGVEWFYNNGAYHSEVIAEQAKQEIENLVVSKTLNEEALLKSFENYMNKIRLNIR